jgi:dihydroneopterin aldolase
MNKQPHLSSAIELAGAKVFVRDIAVQAEIGLYPHEHGRAQPLRVDVELDVTPSVSDHVADIVNYETIVAWTREVAATGHIKLVETFAEQVALACMRNTRVLAARVRVEKPEALAPAVAGVEVLLRRG